MLRKCLLKIKTFYRKHSTEELLYHEGECCESAYSKYKHFIERTLLKGVATIYFWNTLIKDNGDFTLGGIFVQR